MKLTEQQIKWLTKLVNHQKKGYWLSTYTNEEAKIRLILKNGEYNVVGQTFLQCIVTYYTEHIFECGTLNNPL